VIAALLVVMLSGPAELPPVEGPVTLAPDGADPVAPAPAPADEAPTAARPASPPPDIDTLPPPSLGMGELLGPLFKTMLMLAIVVGIAYLTLHKGLGKLVARQNLGRRVKVIERVGLDPRRALFLVEVDGRQLLLGAGEGGVVLLKEMAPEPQARPVTFAATLEAQQRPETT